MILFEEEHKATPVLFQFKDNEGFLNDFRITIKDTVVADYLDWTDKFPIHIWEHCGTEYNCWFYKRTGKLASVIGGYYETEHKQDKLMQNAKNMFKNCGYDAKKIKRLIDTSINDFKTKYPEYFN